MTANLPQVAPPPNALQTLSALSSRLKELLTSPLSSADDIAADPAMIAECRDRLWAIHARASERAGTDGVREVISRRFGTYPQQQRSPEEWAAWWADYFEALADLPLRSLEEAMRAWVASADAEFLPKPGKLRAMARTIRTPALVAYDRASKAIAMDDRAVVGSTYHIGPEKAAALIAEMTSKHAMENAE